MRITSPTDFFRVKPGTDGELIWWEDMYAYYKMLDENSPRVMMREMGKTTEGRPFVVLYISSPENLKNLEKYRKISMALADPRGLEKDEIDKMVSEGKAICMQQYGLHPHEVGGAQAAPEVAYHLASSDDEETLSILENVIFVMIPCAHPDGLDLNCRWNDKYKGTAMEGFLPPEVYHKYAGHANNRDGVLANLVESKYINELLYNEWMPQVYQDHHHSVYCANRMMLPPYTDPIHPETSPLMRRELEYFSAAEACELEAKGVYDVVTDCPSIHFYFYNAFHVVSLFHNVCAMMSESADCRLAHKMYMHPEQFYGFISDTIKMPTVSNPHPWEGGWWTLEDIVYQIKVASIALLSTMAQSRKQTLRNMVIKALEQTKCGEKDSIQAFIVPMRQHDSSSMKWMINALHKLGVEINVSKEAFELEDGRCYPKGTIIVPLAQPKFAFVSAMFKHANYPDCSLSRRPDGSLRVYGTASVNMAAWMGMQYTEANCPVLVETSPFTPFEDEKAVFPCSGAENASYRFANERLNKNEPVWRNKEGDFLDKAEEGAVPAKRKRIGLLMMSRFFYYDQDSNEERGCTRLVLEQFGFPYKEVSDTDVREGKLDDIDILIIPGDKSKFLEEGDALPPGYPPEYLSGLGSVGKKNLDKFVNEGGRLIVWGESCDYTIEALGLMLGNEIKGKSSSEYHAYGSMLRVNYADDPLTLGMKKKGEILMTHGTVFKVLDQFACNSYVRDHHHADNYVSVARFEKEKCLTSGLLWGEKYIAGKSCIMRAKRGKGEAVLFGFDPIFHGQTHGTFKLLFNALFM